VATAGSPQSVADGGGRLDHKNLYTERFPFGKPQLRPDDLWEDDFSYGERDNRFQAGQPPEAARECS